MKDTGVHTEFERLYILESPGLEEIGKTGAGNKRPLEAVVEILRVDAPDLLGHADRKGAEVFGHRAQHRVREVGVVEPDGRDAQGTARGDGFPRDLIRVARLDQIGLFPLERFLHQMEAQQGTVAGCPRHERGGDRVGDAVPLFPTLGLFARNDEHMPVTLGLQPGGLFPDIASHAARGGAVKLG